MPRGDTRTLPIALPIGTWTAGSHLFFTLKPIDDVDGANTDGTAVVQRTLSDTDIISTNTANKNYLLKFVPADTNAVVPGVYRAEIEYVSADSLTVITYPDPNISTWLFTITGDVTRRVA